MSFISEFVGTHRVKMAQPTAIPNWLSGEFLEKHLQNHHNNTKLQVIDYSVKPPANDGNFASKIYRVHVEFDTVASKDDTQSKQGVSFWLLISF